MMTQKQISQKSAFQNRVAERKNSSKLEQISPRQKQKVEMTWEDYFAENPINPDIDDDQKISLLLFKTNSNNNEETYKNSIMS